jgi:ubiquinone/menaquinone biosynthesis C-methylase UbiE
MALFRRLPGGPRDLAISMVGVKLGDRLLQLACGDGVLFAALGAKVGLTGRACAIDASRDGVTRGQRAASAAGVLVEIAEAPYHALPHDTGSFDIVVVYDVVGTLSAGDRAACLREARRVLRAGGRCIIVERTGRRGLAALFGSPSVNPEYARSGGAEAALRAAEFVAVRTLAEREGLRFAEGVNVAR